MTTPYTMIPALVKDTDTAVIHVRATRIWKSYNPYDNKLLHTNVILLDQEGNHIWAKVRNNQRAYCMKTLEENGVFIISRVVVVTAPDKFRCVNRDVSLTFFHETTFEKVNDTGVIPKYKFELQHFDTIGRLIGDVVSFIDVIGWVVSYGDFETTQRGAKKLNIELLNDRQESMTVSLWGDKGPEFITELARSKDIPIFVVITGLLAKTYFGGLALSSGDGTKFYFNIDYEPLNILRSTILAVTNATPDTLPPPKHKSLARPSVPDAIQATIKDILRMKLPPGKQFVHCACRATIIDVVPDDWTYSCCPTCNRSVYLVNGNYRCRTCTEPPPKIKQSYKVSVTVEDDSGTTTFTLFNKDAELLIGIPIEKVIDEMSEDQSMNDIPAVVNNIVGKVCDFEVKVTAYNIQKKIEDYGVTRVTEFQPTMNEGEAEASTSSSKRRKTA